jgi:thiamine phosphate synthase YjbQ (UPF0047 family)
MIILWLRLRAEETLPSSTNPALMHVNNYPEPQSEAICFADSEFSALWEQVFYGEFDGGRKKRVLVKSSGNSARA